MSNAPTPGEHIAAILTCIIDIIQDPNLENFPVATQLVSEICNDFDYLPDREIISYPEITSKLLKQLECALNGEYFLQLNHVLYKLAKIYQSDTQQKEILTQFALSIDWLKDILCLKHYIIGARKIRKRYDKLLQQQLPGSASELKESEDAYQALHLKLHLTVDSILDPCTHEFSKVIVELDTRQTFEKLHLLVTLPEKSIPSLKMKPTPNIIFKKPNIFLDLLHKPKQDLILADSLYNFAYVVRKAEEDLETHAFLGEEGFNNIKNYRDIIQFLTIPNQVEQVSSKLLYIAKKGEDPKHAAKLLAHQIDRLGFAFSMRKLVDAKTLSLEENFLNKLLYT